MVDRVNLSIGPLYLRAVLVDRQDSKCSGDKDVQTSVQ
jgi:hypothetical protein